MKRLVRDKFLITIGVILIVYAAAIAAYALHPGQAIQAREGRLDLSGWRFAEDGTVNLEGEWAFYPHQLLEPGEFRQEPQQRQYVQVPSTWNRFQTGSGESMGSWGYGTYRLLVQIPPTDKLLTIKKQFIRFSEKIYVNGKLLGQSGQPGASREAYKPGNTPYVMNFYAPGDQLEIVVQVANFEYSTGGMNTPLMLGRNHDIMVKKGVQTTLEVAGAIVLLFLGIFYLSIYWLFHKNRSFLAIGTFFICFAITLLFNGERVFMQVFTEVPFELSWKLKDTTSILCYPLIAWFTLEMVSTPLLRRLLLGSMTVFVAYCFVIIAVPYHVYAVVYPAMMTGMAVLVLGLVTMLIGFYIRERFGNFSKRELQLYIAAILALVLSLVTTLLNLSNVLPNMGLADLAIFLFVLLIATMLAQRYFDTYASMEHLMKQLQTADQMKDEFLLRTSHELNTPLHGIINLSHSILEEPPGSGTGTAGSNRSRAKLRLIRNTAYRMSNMVSDIIDLARIKEGRLDVKLSNVDLAACTSVAFEVFGYVAKERRVELANRIDQHARYVRADENRLMQVLYNLIDQGLKASEGGSIAVSSRLEGETVLLEIKYKEMGTAILGREQAMPEAGAADRSGPLGVGLAIVEELVELMGGNLLRDRTVNGGDAGWKVKLAAGAYAASVEPYGFHTEIAAAAWETDDGPDKERTDQAGYTVLVVDDDAIHTELQINLLEVEGYRVITARTEQEALERINGSDRPDIVLLDVMLSGTTGYEVCRRMRKLYSPIELPILFITVRNTPADIEAGLAAGGNDFIARPLDAGEVRARIRTLLAMKRLSKEAAMNEMAFLQSQIKPHFLYNALGTIMSLCYTDGPRAGELLASLSKYLRIIFHVDRKEESVPLQQEMELVQAYVDIERARFGDRIEVSFDVDEHLLYCKVLPLTVQPLVENAIRHGVAKKVNGGTVGLTIRRSGDFVEVIVVDDGVGMTGEQLDALRYGSPNGGVGIANLTKRVLHITGGLPVIESEPDKGTKVMFKLPVAF